MGVKDTTPLHVFLSLSVVLPLTSSFHPSVFFPFLSSFHTFLPSLPPSILHSFFSFLLLSFWFPLLSLPLSLFLPCSKPPSLHLPNYLYFPSSLLVDLVLSFPFFPSFPSFNPSSFSPSLFPSYTPSLPSYSPSLLPFLPPLLHYFPSFTPYLPSSVSPSPFPSYTHSLPSSFSPSLFSLLHFLSSFLLPDRRP